MKIKKYPKIKINITDNNQSYDNNWRMYELLIAELKHQHTEWIDNFRIILSFNSILLPGSYATFALIQQGKECTCTCSTALPFFPWSIVVLSAIGIFATILMISLVFRISCMTDLRQQEVRKIEEQMDLPIYIFLEGAVRSEVIKTEPKNLVDPDIKPMSRFYLRGRWVYLIIGFLFIIAYAFLLFASLFLGL